MNCANCETDGPPAYTLRAHVDSRDDGDATVDEQTARTDGGASATVDLPFCSLECLTAWT
ncbi:hypothetical protein I7X12_01880 [Halosimplex litoreum]|uniref:Uncharacterized protein n=1 Tax=Halosimplex litoreum TaxID=1198301 RepID=A0A7T3FZ56_9EURY|nr:hypothetical protein [Halosimplex litoreum]QPV63410.1 hypothetical protein I7X12_01880 [Halosimplex litoreum]